MRAVITAGGRVDPAFARAIGTEVKALAPCGTSTLIDVAVRACSDAGIDDVAVVGGAEVCARLDGSGVRCIDAGASGGANVLLALDAWPGERFIYLSSDLPFVSGAGIADFARRAQPFALTMALADALAYDARFPDAPPHGVALRGERVINGSAFVIDAAAVPQLRALAVRAFAARKNLFALARLLGPGIIARFVTRRLAVADIEAYGTRLLGLPVGAARDCDPGLCCDVDTLDEYRYACSQLA